MIDTIRIHWYAAPPKLRPKRPPLLTLAPVHRMGMPHNWQLPAGWRMRFTRSIEVDRPVAPVDSLWTDFADDHEGPPAMPEYGPMLEHLGEVLPGHPLTGDGGPFGNTAAGQGLSGRCEETPAGAPEASLHQGWMAVRESDGFRVGGPGILCNYAEVSLPRLMYGHNGRVLDWDDIPAALDKVRDTVIHAVGAVPLYWRIVRMDLAWQFHGDAARLALALSGHRHRRARAHGTHYWDTGYGWRADSLDLLCRVYDKGIEVAQKAGQATTEYAHRWTRAEVQMGAQYLAERQKAAQPDAPPLGTYSIASLPARLDPPSLWHEYRTAWDGLNRPAPGEPTRKKRDAYVQLLADLQAAGITVGGLTPLEHAAAMGLDPRTLQALCRDVQAAQCARHPHQLLQIPDEPPARCDATVPPLSCPVSFDELLDDEPIGANPLPCKIV